MGRLKPRHVKRESKVERFEKHIAIRVMRVQAQQDQREAFIEAFGDVMTEEDKAEYRATGEFDETRPVELSIKQ